MASIVFTVPGKPQPKERPRLGKRGFAYTPVKTQVYEALVARCARAAMHEAGLDPFKGPVFVDLQFYFPIPKSWPKAKREAALSGALWHEGNGDLDNAYKAVADGMNKVVYVDDRQIVKSSEFKKYSDRPRVDVVVSQPPV